jgi:D-alanyl-D-alanine carboxypeptidase
MLEKRAEEKLPIASLTKLMTAVVAHEVIYLGKSIRVTSGMLASAAQIFYPEEGEHYIGLDLLYPLLMQSSNDTANVLSGFIGDETFVRNMNAKAVSLGMADTQFTDPSGISAGDVSTAYDIAKLLQYIYYKRPFLFDIGKGVAFENVGLIQVGDTIRIPELKNVNEFVGSPDLIGVKNGETTAARQTMTTVWNIRTAEGDVPVAIIVLGSEDRKGDTDVLLQWVKNNFAVI